jgi:hypothetical protein
MAVLCAWLIAYPLVAQQPNQPSDLRVQGDAQNRSTVNASVTITAGTTFQTVLASNLGTTTQRQSLEIQNNNSAGTDYCWVHIGTGTPTTANSIALAVGQSYTRYWPLVPSDAIQATCANTSDTLYISYQ